MRTQMKQTTLPIAGYDFSELFSFWKWPIQKLILKTENTPSKYTTGFQWQM